MAEVKHISARCGASDFDAAFRLEARPNFVGKYPVYNNFSSVGLRNLFPWRENWVPLSHNCQL